MQTLALTNDETEFWDRIAPKYAKKPIADPAAYERKLARVGELLGEADRVLEIGCGTGGTALRLAAGVSHITATDVSRGMIEIARSKLGPETPDNVTFRQADAADLAVGRPFDAICAFSLLHLVDDVPHVLDRVRAQLKPGGLFISKTVCVKDGSFLIRPFIVLLRMLGIAPKVGFLDADGLARQLRIAGFEIEELTYFGSNRMNPFIVARRTGG